MSMERVWASVHRAARDDRARVSMRHVFHACLTTIKVDGAGVMLVSTTGNKEPLFSSDASSRRLEELQYALGEGPGHDALRKGGPVLVPDLTSVTAAGRWPGYTSAALENGVRAVFALPLGPDRARIGALDVYRKKAGALSDREFDNALACADAALAVALASLESDEFERGFTHNRAEVHQAAGMVSVQLGIGVDEALTRLRAHAYAADRPLLQVARDVLARTLRLGPADGRDDLQREEGR
ncbi:GAF and ANTAR domain-containing protein [Nonomuraea soli]|uniref:ANTAR domain-containing protein n=1 Tax=Nonomuraea soli TaxID=1032476 RepID=A0A7W0CF30_9ACTN|nr:GAF and ANTAR domain-containing protein [Nonomuraea soli]MBA2890007.1 hypothetical protein [Nonomuraea soli]